MKREASVAGLLAAGPAACILVLGNLASGAPGFLNVVADGTTRFVPLDVFQAVLETLGPLAKGLLLAAVFVGTVVAGGMAGLVWPRFLRRKRTSGEVVSRFSDAVFVGAVAWLLAEVVVLPVMGAGLFGGELRLDPLAVHLPLGLAAFAYGLFFVGIWTGVTATSPAGAARSGTASPVDTPGMTDEPATAGEHATADEPATAADGLTRRSFIGRTLTVLGAGALVTAAGSIGVQILSAARRPAGGAAGVTLGVFGPTPALTLLEDFYVVAKDVLPVGVDPVAWRLRIGGLVDRPRAYTLADLQAKPRLEAFRTLQCISYQVVPGDDLISNQRFAGVRLAGLLDEAGVQPGARFLHLEAADGYTESLPLEVARDPDTWVAYEMGPPGTPLAEKHGFPARLLIAGRYGMKQPKWLNAIVLAAEDQLGYWEQRGWDEQAIVRNMSRIDWPQPGAEVPVGTPFMAYGIANSGDRGISRVEVSADDGRTWQEAELEPRGEPLGPLTWVRWRASLVVAAAGPVVLVARATDGRGERQDGTPRPPLPSGATGWHRVRVIAVPGEAAPS